MKSWRTKKKSIDICAANRMPSYFYIQQKTNMIIVQNKIINKKKSYSLKFPQEKCLTKRVSIVLPGAKLWTNLKQSLVN